ncbi:MAG: hypothetical protein IPH13_13985 [Planctomycetes bacterium]|nr:hypothetical protein [Planctomycetota bacterium]MCC7168862.1 hypothetical protein [Planctomycetota bacterium]
MSARFPAALLVAGFAVLSLTPVAPSLVRDLDVVALHAYRPFAWALREVRERRLANEPNLPGGDEVVRALVDSARDRIAERDAALSDGAAMLPGKRSFALARVVSVDPRSRQLLIDTGNHVRASPGDAVLAGNQAVGMVDEVDGPFAVVKTPWTPRARFAAECGAGEPDDPRIRFVTIGEARDEWLATVSSAEGRLATARVLDVKSADVSDLVPASTGLLPSGFFFGTMEADLKTAKTGLQTYCVRPIFDPRLLDAVVVVHEGPFETIGDEDFSVSTLDRLPTAQLSAWREGEALTGAGAGAAPRGAPVVADDILLGFVDAALLGAAKVRGVTDPGQEHTFLVLGDASSRTIVCVSERRMPHGGAFRYLGGGEPPRAGEIVVTAGRGVHVPRGLLVGQVMRSDGDAFEVSRPPERPWRPVEVMRRSAEPRSGFGP